MDTLSKVVVLVALAYVAVMLFQLAKEWIETRNAESQARVDAEIDRLHK